MRAYNSPGNALQPELEHFVSRWGIYRAQASPADPNRFAMNELASSAPLAYRDMAGGALRVRLSAPRPGGDARDAIAAKTIRRLTIRLVDRRRIAHF